MIFWRAVRVALVLPAVVSAPSAAGQDRGATVIIPEDVSCARCSIALQRLTTVGDSAGPGMLAQQGTVVVDTRGRIFVFTNYDPARIQVFDRGGRHLTSLGGAGAGPGEFRVVEAATVLPGDTLVVFDSQNSRLAVFDPSLRFQRHITTPGRAFQFVPVASGRYVLTGELRSRDAAADPLQLVDSAGQLVRRFGGGAGSIDAGFFNVRRRIGPGTDGTVWSARANEYLLEQYDAGGTRRMALARRPSWFEPWAVPVAANRDRPKPEIRDVRQHGDRLWVLVHVADARWEPRAPVQCGGPGMLCVADSDWERIFDSVIDVIDVPTRRVVASTRVPQRLLGFAGDGVAASYEEDADGNPRYAIWRLVLRDP